MTFISSVGGEHNVVVGRGYAHNILPADWQTNNVNQVSAGQLA